MKKIFILIALFLLTFQGGCQEAQTFDKVATFNAGFRFTPTGTIYTSIPTGTYPVAGIAVSSGTGWLSSIQNNSANWNTAFSWGNHTGIYRPITWVPKWSEVTEKPEQIELKIAIAGLDYLPIPSKTNAQINALVMPSGATGIVYDNTLRVYKFYQNGTWVINTTGQ